MLTASLLLAALAFALAWPIPVVLSRAAWPSRAPATALVLWQAIALSGGLSMIGSLLVFGLIPFGDTLLEGGIAFGHSLLEDRAVATAELPYLTALCGAILLAVHLVLNLVLTLVVSQRQRRRHRQLVELLSTPSPNRPHTRIIDQAVPVAYCLPGTQHSVTIFSAGLLELLDEAELRGVIEHEKAHLMQRHYIVLMAFGAWRSSLPWFPIATRAHEEVTLLVEMLADDYARRAVDKHTLATAIALVSLGTPTASTDATRGSVSSLPTSTAFISDARQTGKRMPRAPRTDQLTSRISRLLGGQPGLSYSQRLCVLLLALALVAVPTILLLEPGF